MEILRSVVASAYLDGLSEDRERSAILAIHLTWLNNYSSMAKKIKLISSTPLDMLVLYRAAADAFREPLSSDKYHYLLLPNASEGHVVNFDQAIQQLSMVEDPQKTHYAFRFLGEVIRLSSDASCRQDLKFFLELFLSCLDHCPVANILNGEVSKSSRRLADHDFW